MMKLEKTLIESVINGQAPNHNTVSVEFVRRLGDGRIEFERVFKDNLTNRHYKVSYYQKPAYVFDAAGVDVIDCEEINIRFGLNKNMVV